MIDVTSSDHDIFVAAFTLANKKTVTVVFINKKAP
jgi:hypothetical protein